MKHRVDMVKEARRGLWGAALALGIALLLPNVNAQVDTIPMGRPLAMPAPAAAPMGLGLPVPSRPVVPAGPTTIRMPLRQLIGAKEPIYLMMAQSTYTVFLPISPRYDVHSCKLHLSFTNSIALLSERSVMRVVLNDQVIAQYYLTRNEPDKTVDVELPVKNLHWGSNQLQFIVAQHYTLECEDPAAPELWTQIHPDDSYFEAVVSYNNVYPKLSLLRDLIDQKLWNTYSFNVCFPGGSNGNLTPSQLSWGSIVTQGAALNLNYRPLNVSTGGSLVAGMDNIVVGQMSELTQYLTPTEIQGVDSSYISMKTMPGDPTHFVLIITGTNEEQVGQAAYAFSLINFPLPDSTVAHIPRISIPDHKAFWRRNPPVKDPGIYSFRQMGMEHDQSIQGWNTGASEIDAYMPGDLSQDDGSNIELRLHFAYGAAFRDDSVLNVFVNQEFQTAIRLDDIRGAMHYGHRLYLPVKAFQPGRNVVTISPKMVPLKTDHCMMIQDENLWFTLYRDSDFVVPPLERKARLPSFTLISQTAFPYSDSPNGSDSPDGSELAVLMAGKDNVSICAAWVLLGKMAQIGGSVLYLAEFTYTAPLENRKKDLLVVGPLDSIPDEVLQTAPVNPQQLGRLRYVVGVSPTPEATALGPIEEILEKLRGVPEERSEREQPTTVEMGVTAQMLDDTMAVSYESPYAPARLATVITARDADTLYRGISSMADRQIWDNLDGNLAVWGSDPRTLATARLGPEFIYKVDNPIRRSQQQFNSNPLLFVLVVFITIGALAFVTRFLLRKREKPGV